MGWIWDDVYAHKIVAISIRGSSGDVALRVLVEEDGVVGVVEVDGKRE